MAMDENDLDNRLHDSLRKIERAEIDTPELGYFTELVKQEKLRIAKKQKLQFAVFIVAAILIISAILLILFASALAFSVLQGGLLVLFMSLILRKVREGEIDE
jgi:hypothetical protein